MRISVTRTGGYAGEEQVATLDTSELAPDAAAEIRRAVESANLPALAQRGGGGTVGADVFRWRITVSDGGERTVAFADDDHDPAVEPLRRLVETVARAKP